MRSHLKVLAVLVAAFAIALVAALPAAGDSDAARLANLHDQERSEHGLGSLARAGDLTGDAQSHAREMASRGEIYHSGRTSDLNGWYALGENVGWGSTVDEIFDMFLDSPSHRANIVDRSWDSMGVGVASTEDGAVYVAVLFGDRADRQAKAAPSEPRTEQPRKKQVRKPQAKAPERKRVPAPPTPTPAPSGVNTPIPVPEADSAAPIAPAPPAPPVPAEPQPSDASRAVGVLLAVEREHREEFPEEAATIGDVTASSARRLFSESEAERRRLAAASPQGAAARSLGGVAREAWR